MINLKKLLAGTLSAAMVFGTMAMPVFADEETAVTEMTFAEFLNKATDNNVMFDGKSYTKTEANLKVVLEPQSVCEYNDCTGAVNAVEPSEANPINLDSGMAQYKIWSDKPENRKNDVTVSNVDFVYKPAEFCIHTNSGWKTYPNKVNPENGQIQVLNSGAVKFENCGFDGVNLNFYRDNNNPGEGKSVTIDNCDFKNISMGAGIKWIGTETATITNNEFTNCKAGVMFAPTGGTPNLTVTGNTFDTIAEEVVQLAGNADYTTATNVKVSNNAITNPTNGTYMFRIEKENAKVTEFDNNTGSETIPMAKDGASKKVVAQIGSVLYTTLKDAMQAACNMNVEDVNGVPTQTIPVTIDLVSDIKNQEGFSAYGGEIKNGYGWHFVHKVDITLNGNGHKIDTGIRGSNHADNNKSPYIDVSSNEGKFTVNNVIAPNDLLFTVTKPGHATSDCKNEARAESLVVENCEFYGSNIGYDSTVNTVMYKNNKFLLTENENDHPDAYPLWYKFDWAIKKFTFEGNTVKSQRALNLARFSENSEIVINNNNFTIANTENSAKSAAIMLAENHTDQHPYTGNLTFRGNTVDAHSAVIIYSPSEYNTNFTFAPENNTLVNNTKLVGFNEWSGSYSDENAKKAAEALVNKIASTNAVSVKFNPTADKTVYDIVLSGEGKNINRLTSADLTFKLDTDDAITYEIKKAGDMNVTPKADDYNRYLFNFDGENTASATDTEIVIGQVEFTGYGKFTFGVDNDATANIVNATKTVDNIVTSYVVNGGTTTSEGTLDLGNGIPETELKPETANLTVNVSFPNAVKNNAAAYQNMKVTVSGNGVNEVAELGTDANFTEPKTTGTEVTPGYYTVNFENKLVKNNAYTVTVSGAGYRTARYTVSMTGDKELNFWNNVKTAPMVIEKDSTGTGVNTNFLAGDIVKDGQINIYDLSAVVSYFGANGLSVSNHPEYAKYDLNRDGVIDSMDVAYVLVSWGK